MAKILKGLLAATLAALLVLPGAAFAMLPEANARSSTGPTVAGRTVDPDTRERWTHWAAGGGDESRLTTENVGRIWTDKTVREAGDGSESDFETTLSAMSSTSDTTSLTNKPLDIVLVLDASGSMSNPMGNGDSTKRIDALKDAANSFVDTIAAQNANITDADKQHQVAIVKFAGDESNRVGNDMYDDGQNTYNYSQVMKALAACTAGSVEAFKDTVNRIKPAGATRADNGMKRAESIVGREDAQKIVVFFTDGTPTSFSEFAPEVAGGAVTSAKKMKDEGAVIYTIGIFGDANPSADVTAWGTSNENKFMQAMSGNYPQATYEKFGWNDYRWNFGSRTENSDYYKSATNADELKKVFEGISQAITSGSGYPTETRDGYETKDGYITFTDELGDFMQVDSFTNAIIDGKEFGAAKKTTNGTTDTYEFSGAAKNLVVAVERAGSDKPRQGDKVTVRIPAALIPLREYKVDKAKGTFAVEAIGSVSPIRVVYTSSVKDIARQNLFTPGEVKGLADYIEGHRNLESNTVYFLANKWSGGELGDTVAAFEPADTNSYYYFQKDTPIYTDEACTERAVKALDPGVIYYYKDEFVAKGADGKPVDSHRVVSFPGEMAAQFDGALKADGTGYYFTKGIARLAYIDQLHTEKDAVGGNKTATARDVLNPRWNKTDTIENATHVQSHLGNNGKIAFGLGTTPATLDTKVAFGLTKVLAGRDWTDTDGFTFNFELDAAKSSDLEGVDRLQGSTTVTKADVDEGDAAKIDFGSFTFTRPGTYVYKVWELKGGSAHEGIAHSDNAVTVTVEVTIDAAGALHATVKPIESPVFTNTYTAETPADGALVISANKTLTGRAMADGEFTFGLGYAKANKLFDSAKNKDGKVTFAPIKFTTAAKAKDGWTSLPELVRSGRATLGATEDGKRGWTIKYVAAEETGKLPSGVSAALGKLEVTVTVVDNGDGTLAATADYGELGNTFKNEYRTDNESIELEGSKDLEAADGLTPPDIAGQFTFTVTGEDGAPMPTHTSVTNDANGGVDFGQITFTLDDLNRVLGSEGGKREHAFAYTIAETGEVPGVTNDAQMTRQVKFTVCDNGKGDLSVTRDPEADISFTFTNTYDVKPAESRVTDQVAVTKQLAGRDLRDGEFSFELVEGKGDDAKVVATGNNAADGTIAMSPITYDKPGKHMYTLREVDGGTVSRGVTYDDATYTVETTVTDNGDGALSVKHALKGSDTAVFKNEYRVVPLETEVDFGLTKQLVGRDWADDERFDFEISAAEGSPENTPLPIQTRVSVRGRDARDGKAPVRFGKIRFTAAGTYKYQIREVAGDIAGIAYDSHGATATVTVTEDGEGNLTAAAPTVSASTFTNSYRSVLDYGAMGGLSISKTLSGRPMAAGQFRFTVTPTDEASAAALGLEAGPNTFASPATAEGTVGLIDVLGGRSVEFTQADAGKTFSYAVAEVNDGKAGYTYDDAVRTVTISVADNGDGTLTATTTVSGGASGTLVTTYTSGKQTAERAVVPFVNSYSATTDAPGGTGAQVVATKTLDGRDMVDGEFFFGIAYAGETEAIGGTVCSNINGQVSFGTLHYSTQMLADLVSTGCALRTDAGGHLAWTVNYTAFEYTGLLAEKGITAEKESFGFKVVVVDNGDGTLTATPDYGGEVPAFENTYDASSVEAELAGAKVLKAAPGLAPSGIAGKFTFTVTGEEGAPMPERASVSNDASGNVNFGKITFTLDDLNAALGATDEAEALSAADEELDPVPAPVRSHTFVYNITESDTDGKPTPGVTNDPQPTRTVKYTVTDNGNGTLSVMREPEQGAAFTFANTYGVTPAESRVTDQIAATKQLAGRDLADGEFSFELVEDGAVVATGVNDATGAISMTPIVYAEPGTHVYTMREVIPSASGVYKGVTYDGTTYTVETVVTDRGDGTLDVKHALRGADAAVFSNTYEAKPVTVKLGAVKVLEGRAIKRGEFAFILNGDDGTERAASNSATGAIDFGAFIFAEAGTHVYTIAEIAGDESGVTYDRCVYTATVEVTDDGEGYLTAKVSYKTETQGTEGIVFHNTYKTPEEPKTPGKPDGPGVPRTPNFPPVVIKTVNKVATHVRGLLPATGDQTAGALVLTGILAAIGASLIVWTRHRS